MHADSPLQKNAPIFGNDFTVTFHVLRITLFVFTIYIYIKKKILHENFTSTLVLLLYG